MFVITDYIYNNSYFLSSMKKVKLTPKNALFLGFLVFSIVVVTLYVVLSLRTKTTNSSEVLAQKLYDEVKVLCWVSTWAGTHKTKAKAVQKTWGKRCNKILFVSNKNDSELGTIVLPIKDGRPYFWSKTKAAFTYVYKNHFQEYDWFVKADDDT